MNYSNKQHSNDRPRLPIYLNLRDSPQNMNQESIFARLAKKHKKKPEVPVVSLDDDESSIQGSVENREVNTEETVVSTEEDEIYIISDTEDGEICDTGKASNDSEMSRNTSMDNLADADQPMSLSDGDSSSSSELEVIELTDSDDESTDEVLVVKEVVSPQGDMTSARKTNLNKYCEPSLDTGFSRGCYKDFKVHPRLWRIAQDLPVDIDSSVIKICSYNVLCQLTIETTRHLYKHARNTPDVMKWKNRWQLMQKEIERIDADVFCFQEVQYDHFSSHFNPLLAGCGYGGFYKRKTGECVDGCAIFYKKSVFKSIKYRVVEYFVKDNSEMDRPQIAQILRLRCLKNGQDVIIANTHILFNNQRGDIKIGQLALLFANIHDEMRNGEAPLILMGDFNMEAYSYVYRFITEASLFLKGLPRNELSGQGKTGGPTVDADYILPKECQVLRDCMYKDDGNRDIPKDTFTHPLQLASVYNHVNSNNLKDVSTAHIENANPDFIFYTIKRKVRVGNTCQVYEDTRLRLLKYLTLPDADVIQNTLGPWPNKHVPSDHIPVIAEFLLSYTK
ncbi:unnamed protein product [Auanema sp. JU1783]|nr:unnamed protein product [Auanema sp. JU1783]